MAARPADASPKPLDKGTRKDIREKPDDKVQTSSGIEVKPFYKPEDVADISEERDLGRPGEYPFTRGIYPSMYRRRLWTMRQYAGFGTAAESNRRYKYLLSQGQTDL